MMKRTIERAVMSLHPLDVSGSEQTRWLSSCPEKLRWSKQRSSRTQVSELPAGESRPDPRQVLKSLPKWPADIKAWCAVQDQLWAGHVKLSFQEKMSSEATSKPSELSETPKADETERPGEPETPAKARGKAGAKAKARGKAKAAASIQDESAGPVKSRDAAEVEVTRTVNETAKSGDPSPAEPS